MNDSNLPPKYFVLNSTIQNLPYSKLIIVYHFKIYQAKIYLFKNLRHQNRKKDHLPQNENNQENEDAHTNKNKLKITASGRGGTRLPPATPHCLEHPTAFINPKSFYSMSVHSILLKKYMYFSFKTTKKSIFGHNVLIYGPKTDRFKIFGF